MNKLKDIFDIEYPATLIFSEQKEDKKGVNFVSSTGKNNGVTGKVSYDPSIKMYFKGSITVPLKGTVVQAYLQLNDFYCAHQIAVLTVKKNIKMSDEEKLFYCYCIRHNKFRFNYGRQADRTLPNLLVPSKENLPQWIKDTKINNYSNVSDKLKKNDDLILNVKNWKEFKYSELFTIERGKGPRKKDAGGKGKVPVVTSIDGNNGLISYTEASPMHQGNTIGVNRNGSVGEAYYQPIPFCSTEDVHIFTPKFKLNKFIGLFLVTLIKLEKYRFNYGRKWGISRMQNSKIKLPVDENDKIDFNFMENYIQSLNFSNSL